MDNQILQDLQLFGLDENVTAKELHVKWRHLSAHTHPDRYKKGTTEWNDALAKQTRLNCAKDRLTAYIELRDAETKAAQSRKTETETYSSNEKSQTQPEETEVDQPEYTLNPSRALVDELSSVGMFLGAMFLGVAVACLVSVALPFLATTAPIILVTVLLVTMFGALFKMHKWCISKAKELSHGGTGVISNAK